MAVCDKQKAEEKRGLRERGKKKILQALVYSKGALFLV